MCVPKKQTILPLTNTMSDGWTCEKCVGKKYRVWCEADPFFGGKSSCVSTIDSSNGFYGDCSDITFGADNLESSLDCTFKSSNGELFLALIIGSIVLVVFLGTCRMVRGQWCEVGGLSRSQRLAQRALHSVQMNQNPHQQGQVLGIGQQQQPVPMYRQQPIQIVQPVPIQPMQPVQPIVPVPVQPMYLQQQQQQQPVIAQAVPIYQKNNKN